jgi:hypothetical protein
MGFDIKKEKANLRGRKKFNPASRSSGWEEQLHEAVQKIQLINFQNPQNSYCPFGYGFW